MSKTQPPKPFTEEEIRIVDVALQSYLDGMNESYDDHKEQDENDRKMEKVRELRDRVLALLGGKTNF